MLTVTSTSGAISPNSIHSSICCRPLTQCLCQNLLSRVGSTLTTISLMVYWLINHSVLINQGHQFSRSGIALYPHQLVNAMGKRLSSCLEIISKFSLQKHVCLELYINSSLLHQLCRNSLVFQGYLMMIIAWSCLTSFKQKAGSKQHRKDLFHVDDGLIRNCYGNTAWSFV